MDKIKVFVGSSVGGLSHARAVKQNLDYDAWFACGTRVFSAPQLPVGRPDRGSRRCRLRGLHLSAGRHPDPQPHERERRNQGGSRQRYLRARNVRGRLGRDRVFMIKPEAGTAPPVGSQRRESLRFQRRSEPAVGVGTAADEIRARIQKLGPKAATRESQSPATPGYDRVLALANATPVPARSCTAGNTAAAM